MTRKPTQIIFRIVALVLVASAPLESAHANAFTAVWKALKTAFRTGGDEAVEGAGRIATHEGERLSERALKTVLSDYPPVLLAGRETSEIFVDLTTKAFRGELTETIGRNLEIRDLQEALMLRSGGHAVLTGKPGVGKGQLVEGLTHAIIQQGPDLPEQLKNTRVIQLNRSVVTSGASVQGNLDATMADLKKILTDLSPAQQEKIVLVLEDIEEWAGLLQGPGSDVKVLLSRLKEIADSTRVKMVFTSTEDDFTKIISNHPISRILTQVRVEAPTLDNAYDMVRVHLPEFEKTYGVSFPVETVSTAIRMADKFVTDLELPGSAIRLLERAAVHVNVNRTRPRVLLDLENQIATLERKLKETSGRIGPKFERDAVTLERQLADVVRRKQFIEQMHEDVKRYSSRLGELTSHLEQLQYTLSRTVRDADKISLHTEIENLAKEVDFVRARIRERAINLSMGNDVDINALAEVIARARGSSPEKILEEIGGDANYLAGVAEKFYARIVGQRHVVNAVLRHLENTKEMVLKGVRGAFLGVGPSQTGKSEFGRALGDIYGEGKVLRIDCGQYKDRTAVSAMVGANQGYLGYGEGGLITNFLKANPDGVVWFDEIEKADPSLFDILLSALDPADPHIETFATGKLSTRENIFWMTGNLLQGPQDPFTKRALDAGLIQLADIDDAFLRSITDPQQLTEHLQKVLMNLKDEFGNPVIRNELFNRLHGIFKFYPFNTAEMVDLVEVMIQPVIKNFDSVHIGLSLDNEVLQALARRSGREFGNSARVSPNIEHFISSRVNNLRNPPEGSAFNKIKEGDLVHVTLRQGASLDGAENLGVQEFQELFEFHVYTYEDSDQMIRTFAFSESAIPQIRSTITSATNATEVQEMAEAFDWIVERP